eukprot:scaffold21241_cov30-Tisochrysis_lutea.AAC.2
MHRAHYRLVLAPVNEAILPARRASLVIRAPSFLPSYCCASPMRAVAHTRVILVPLSRRATKRSCYGPSTREIGGAAHETLRCSWYVAVLIRSRGCNSALRCAVTDRFSSAKAFHAIPLLQCRPHS